MLDRLLEGKPLTPKTALRLSAPHTWLPCSILPGLFAVLLCIYWGYPMTVTLASVLIAICVLMQGSVNTLNDFFDFIKGMIPRPIILSSQTARSSLITLHPFGPGFGD